MGRWSKIRQFLSSTDWNVYSFHPWPWQLPCHPYFVANPLQNPDGHGGYSLRFPFDENGLPYRRVDGQPWYDPLLLSRYAFKMLQIATEEGDPEARRKGLTVLPFLVESGERNGIWGRASDPRAMSRARPSCMIQGTVISAILRLTEGDPGPRERRVIEAARAWLVRPVEEGGVVSRLDGGPFLEEIPRVPPSHVLNGCIYGLFGLYDLADTIGDERAAEMAIRVEETLVRTIDRFVTPTGWSWYALHVYGHRLVASLHYHRAHVLLLEVVARRTGVERLRRVAQRWRVSLARPASRVIVGTAKFAQVVLLRDILRLPLLED